jgi:benzodiazapine receptor
MLNIIPQWAIVAATAGVFYRLDKVACACLVPLAVWVAYAGILNIAIWRLNG